MARLPPEPGPGQDRATVVPDRGITSHAFQLRKSRFLSLTSSISISYLLQEITSFCVDVHRLSRPKASSSLSQSNERRRCVKQHRGENRNHGAPRPEELGQALGDLASHLGTVAVAGTRAAVSQNW